MIARSYCDATLPNSRRQTVVIEPEKNIQLTWHAKKLKIKIITLHNVCAVYWGEGREDVQYTGGISLRTPGGISLSTLEGGVQYTGVSIQIQLFSQ